MNGLPSIPKPSMPKPYKKRAMTIHGLLNKKLAKMGSIGNFKVPKLKGIKFPNAIP